MVTETHSKIGRDQRRVAVPAEAMTALAAEILEKSGCHADTASIVAEHLVEANLMGVESHGVMRLLQYVEQFRSGQMVATGRPRIRYNQQGAWMVDGNDGIGITAMIMAMEHGCGQAREHGISATAIVNCGHTGRLGAFAEAGARQGCLSICIGGGNRQNWRMVSPYGGARALLPTNPYAFGIPGGERGPVTLDFATSKIAGGWIYAAKSAGYELPDNAVIDANGEVTRDPEDYFNGGAILPFGGAKGYGLALMAELIGEAMLGPTTTEINWLLVCIDVSRYRRLDRFQQVSEEILAELRQCPPSPGFDKVEIPGERERDQYHSSMGEGVRLPEATWGQICELATELGISPPTGN